MIHYWLLLFFILTPVIMFAVKPEAAWWLRVGRLLLAMVLGYVLLNAILHWEYNKSWEAVYAFRKQFPQCEFHPCDGEPKGKRGPVLGVALLLGWIPAAGYVGFWEFFWRRRYRAAIQEMGKTLKGDDFSKYFMGLA